MGHPVGIQTLNYRYILNVECVDDKSEDLYNQLRRIIVRSRRCAVHWNVQTGNASSVDRPVTEGNPGEVKGGPEDGDIRG